MLDWDYDGDGIDDSSSSVHTELPYNMLNPRHHDQEFANFLFMDGRVDARPALDWVLDKDGLRGTWVRR